MSAVEWVHPGSLRCDGRHPAIFVFDDHLLNGYSLKRIAFLYECLLELPVALHRGAVEEEIPRFARLHDASEVVAYGSPDPLIQKAVAAIERSMPVRLIEPDPFVNLHREPDLRRFSRYWSRVEPHLIG